MKKIIKVSVLGATGYTGLELVKLLIKHPSVQITHLTSESSVGQRYSDIYPIMESICDKVLINNDYEYIAESSDAVFLCLPHGASMDAVKYFYDKKLPVFDLSADYRIKDSGIYNNAYKTVHKYPDLLSIAAYGLAEIFHDEIRRAPIVAVPGCYPTSILLPLLPLLKAGMVDKNDIIANSTSGVSGAGKKATDTTHFCESHDDYKPYGIFTHRHKPEMDHIVHRYTLFNSDIVFTPHLAPFNRGMVSTIYAKSNKSADDIRQQLMKSYDNCPFVRILPEGRAAAVKYVVNTPFIDISIFKNGERLILVSAIDNLLKGASSQALQCFNIKYDLEMTAGLI